MDLAVLDERDFFTALQENNRQTFLKMIEKYESYIAPIMRTQGFKRINQKERTVIFSFGEMTFSRSRWKKGDVVRIPVDEKLGLKPRARFSQELLYQLTTLSNFMPYRKVVSVMELLKNIYITKNSVQRALETAGGLLKERDEYRVLAVPEEKKRIKPEILYVEGDGVWVKQSHPETETKSVELSHFVVHTGSKRGKRNVLKNKMEVVSTQYYKAKDKLIDLIYNHFEITPKTLIITNSDGGHGYSPHIFQDLASDFKPKAHFHFWDAFHVHQALKINLTPLSAELTEEAFKAIKKRDKSRLKTVLDTAESLIDSDNKFETFGRFKRQLLRNFQYTVTPEQIGLSSSGIGIMESQHRKIAYRMKNRGMYWSKKGADTMSRTILLNHTGELRDLFFGNWRTEYEKIQEIDDTQRERLTTFRKVHHALPDVRPSRRVKSYLYKK